MGIEEVDGHVTDFRDAKPVVVASEKSGEGAWESQVERDGTEGETLGASPGGASVPQAEREIEEPCRGPSEKSSEEELAVHPANGEWDSAFENKERERVSGSVDGAINDATVAELLEDVVLKTDETEGTSIASTETTGSAASKSPPETLESLAPTTSAAHEAESAVSKVSNKFPTTAESTPVFQKKRAVDTLKEEAPVVKDCTKAAGINFDEVAMGTPQQQPVSQEVVVFDQAGSVPDDTRTTLVTSTQPSHGKDVAFTTPTSYNLDEVASNLYATAEKVLEQTESSGNVATQNAIAHTVAQIVLEQSNDTIGSSKEYIAGVVQKVAGFAQEASQSADPNILPDTVARIFDGETTSPYANQVIQPKGTASLGTMVSLFVIWCVSLCTSHMDSQDLPAPALKLAAEEVASVLSSSEPTHSHTPQETAAASTQ